MKTYTRADLRALLELTDEAIGDEGEPVRYVFRDDGLWLVQDAGDLWKDPQVRENLTGRSIWQRAPDGAGGFMLGVPGDDGRARPLLPFPFTPRDLLAFDELAREISERCERCERGDETEAWIDDLAQATGPCAKQKHNAAELARYVLGLAPLPEVEEPASPQAAPTAPATESRIGQKTKAKAKKRKRAAKTGQAPKGRPRPAGERTAGHRGKHVLALDKGA